MAFLQDAYVCVCFVEGAHCGHLAGPSRICKEVANPGGFSPEAAIVINRCIPNPEFYFN